MGEVFSGEFQKTLSASIAFDRSNAEWAKPKPLTERANTQGGEDLMCLLFFC